MKLMLDTNVLNWLHTQPQKLGKRTLRKMDQASTIFYSPLTFFEWVQKDDRQGIGAMKLIEATKAIGLSELPLSAAAALEARRFGNLRGRDPIDLLILAQAANEGVDLYTSDMELLALDLDFVKDSTL